MNRRIKVTEFDKDVDKKIFFYKILNRESLQAIFNFNLRNVFSRCSLVSIYGLIVEDGLYNFNRNWVRHLIVVLIRRANPLQLMGNWQKSEFIFSWYTFSTILNKKSAVYFGLETNQL